MTGMYDLATGKMCTTANECGKKATDIRIAGVSDWGTGTREAAVIAKLMDGENPHFAIHLGDVYFVSALLLDSVGVT